MPRKPRFNLVGIPQHVIQRSNNREPCFYAKDDFQHYLTDLYESAVKFDCLIHAYILMTNHVHLLVTPMQEYGVSQMMQAIGRRYVYYINKNYNRTGTLWEGRYKSSLIDSDNYLLTCMRYIELNPVRAGLVKHPGEYKWSSYHANAQGSKDSIIESHPLYNALDKTDAKCQKAYRELFQHHVNDNLLHEIRISLNHELVFGRSYFKDRIEEITKRQVRLGQPGRPKVKENRGIYLVGH